MARCGGFVLKGFSGTCTRWRIVPEKTGCLTENQYYTSLHHFEQIISTHTPIVSHLLYSFFIFFK